MKKNNSETKTIIVICAVALAVVATVIFFSFALPAVKGKNIFKNQISAFENESFSDSFILINDPYNSAGSALPTTVDIVLDSGDASKFADEFISVIKCARFAGSDRSIHGFWDISVSLRQYGGKNMIFLRENSIYVVDNDMRYIFEFKDGSDEEKTYSKFYENVVKRLADRANENA